MNSDNQKQTHAEFFERSELVQGGGMKMSWAGCELVPGGQDQLTPQKRFTPGAVASKKIYEAGHELVPGFGISTGERHLGKLTTDLCSLA